jgi:hypothetical protein
MSSQTQSSQTPSKRPRPAKSTPLSPPAAPPPKRVKPGTPSPPVTGNPIPKPPKAKDDGPPDPAILAIFRKRWSLNRDHLIANVLSAQKSDTGRFTWVDFLPPFHTHLVQRARALLPPLCPMAKGKKALFAFVIEILDGDGPTPGSFWAVPKKRRCRLPKKPKDPEEKTPGSQDNTPTASHKAPADVQKLVAGGNDVMTGVVPSVHVDLPQPPSSSLLPARSPGLLPYVNTFVSANPFPKWPDRASWTTWIVAAEAVGIPRIIMVQIAEEAGLKGFELMIFCIKLDPFLNSLQG